MNCTLCNLPVNFVHDGIVQPNGIGVDHGVCRKAEAALEVADEMHARLLASNDEFDIALVAAYRKARKAQLGEDK